MPENKSLDIDQVIAQLDNLVKARARSNLEELRRQVEEEIAALTRSSLDSQEARPESDGTRAQGIKQVADS